MIIIGLTYFSVKLTFSPALALTLTGCNDTLVIVKRPPQDLIEARHSVHRAANKRKNLIKGLYYLTKRPQVLTKT